MSTEAAALARILLTRDVNTMPAHFARFVTTSVATAGSLGVVARAQGKALGVVIEALHEFWACSAHTAWRNQFIAFLPFTPAQHS